MLTAQLCSDQSLIYEAIIKKQGSIVRGILEQGHNAGVDSEGRCLLYAAMTIYDEDDPECSMILHYVASRNPNLYSETIVIEGQRWPNFLEYIMASPNVNIAFLKYLFTHHLPSINTSTQALSFLIDSQLINKGQAFSIFNSGFSNILRMLRLDNLAMLELFSRLKVLFTAFRDTYRLGPEQDSLFLYLALKLKDYQFACELLIDYKVSIKQPMLLSGQSLLSFFLSDPNANDPFVDPLAIELVSKHEDFERDRKSAEFQQYFKSNDTFDDKLLTAMLTFLNPCQLTLHPQLSTALRIKLAITYLRNELTSKLELLNDHGLENLLINKVLNYYFIALKEILPNLIISRLYQGKQYIDQMAKNIITSYVKSYLGTNINYLITPASLNTIIKYLASLTTIYHPPVEIKRILIQLFALHKVPRNLFQGPLLLKDPAYIDMSISIIIRAHNYPLLNSLLQSPLLELITKDQDFFERFVEHVQSSRTILSRIPLGKDLEDLQWLKECILIFYITNRSLSMLTHVVQQVRITYRLLHKAINNFNECIVSLLLENIDAAELTILFFQNLFIQAFNKMYWSVVDKLFKLLLASNALITKSHQTQFDQLILSLILRSKKNIYLSQFLEYQNKLTPNASGLPAGPANSVLLDNHIPLEFSKNSLPNKYVRILKKALIRRRCDLEMAKVISNHSVRTNIRPQLKEIVDNNYLTLIQNLIVPQHVTDQFAARLSDEKKVHKLTILTPDEKRIYRKLRSAPWKMTHRVKNVDDIARIQAVGKIEPLDSLKELGVVPQYNATAKQPACPVAFATIGPFKSPIPNFLMGSGGFEIDLNSLLLKHPNFLQDAYISSHWFAFEIEQAYYPINYMGNISYTKHTNFLQVENVRQPDLVSSIFNHLPTNLYRGNTIHILCLLFILRLRSIGGRFYDYVLANMDNDTLLSDAFCHLMHSGRFEIRLPFGIPIDTSYTRVLTPNPDSTPDQDIERALIDTDFLDSCIKKGFSPSTRLFTHPTSNLSGFYFGDFLTKAILSGQTATINYLLNEGQMSLTINRFRTTPLQAAGIKKDSDTILRLLTKGCPIKNFQDVAIVPLFESTHENLSILHHLNEQQLLHLATYGIPDTLDLLIFTSCQKLPDASKQQQKILIEAINIAIKRGGNPNFFLDEYNRPVVYAIEAHCNELAALLLQSDRQISFDWESNHTYFTGATQCAIYYKNEKFLEQILTFLTPANMAFNLLLMLGWGYEQIFRKGMYQFYKDLKPKQGTQTLLRRLVADFYSAKNLEDSHEQISGWLLDFNRQCRSSSSSFTKMCSVLFNTVTFGHHLRKWQSIETVVYLAEHLGHYSLSAQIQFINNNFYLKEYLIHELLGFEDRILLEDLQALLKEHKNNPVIMYYLILESSIYTKILDMGLILKFILSNNLNYARQSRLATFMVKPEVFDALMDLFIKNQASPDEFIQWLKKIIEDEAALSWLLPLRNEILKLNFYLRQNHLAITAKLDPAQNSQDSKVAMIIHELGFPAIKQASFDDILWAHKFMLRKSLTALPKIDLEPGQSPTLFNIGRAQCELYKSVISTNAAVAFITSFIAGKQHIYLGQKIYYGRVLPYLLAPGGFTNGNVLNGMVREIKEETGFTVHLPDIIPYNSLESFGELNLATMCPNDNHYNTPQMITILHQNSLSIGHNAQGAYSKLQVSYVWLKYQVDLSQHLCAKDDFTNGIWVPIDEIVFNANTQQAMYKEQVILQSNAMLINLIKGQTISRSQLNITLYKERIERLRHKPPSTTFFQVRPAAVNIEQNSKRTAVLVVNKEQSKFARVDDAMDTKPTVILQRT